MREPDQRRVKMLFGVTTDDFISTADQSAATSSDETESSLLVRILIL